MLMRMIYPWFATIISSCGACVFGGQLVLIWGCIRVVSFGPQGTPFGGSVACCHRCAAQGRGGSSIALVGLRHSFGNAGRLTFLV